MSNPTHPRKRTFRQGRALIRSWRQSGLSAAAFARQIGVHPNRITFWKRRLALAEQPATPAQPTAFIQIPDVSSGAAVAVPETALPAQTIEAVLPNGIRLTIHPGTAMPYLVAVVGALSRLGAAC
jgi:transposase-like protein